MFTLSSLFSGSALRSSSSPTSTYSIPKPPNSRYAKQSEECNICFLQPLYFPSFPPSEACDHPSQVCHSCLQEVIRVAVGDGRVKDGIACPNEGCEESMQYSDVKTWARKEDFEAYDMLLLRLQLGDEEEFIRCLNVSCTAGQFHSGADDTPLITCHACGAKQCHQHRSVWHEGYTCTQWDEEQRLRSRDNETSHEVIKTITKACPGPGCGKRIQKADGCNHMTCKPPGGCGWEFCWLCLAPYEPIRRFDNSRHYDHCEYYSGAPNGNPAPSTVRPNAPATIRNAPAGPSTDSALRFRYQPETLDEEIDSDDSGTRYPLRRLDASGARYPLRRLDASGRMFDPWAGVRVDELELDEEASEEEDIDAPLAEDQLEDNGEDDEESEEGHDPLHMHPFGDDIDVEEEEQEEDEASDASSNDEPDTLPVEVNDEDESEEGNEPVEEDQESVGIHPFGDDIDIDEAEQDEDGNSAVSSDNGEPQVDEEEEESHGGSDQAESDQDALEPEEGDDEASSIASAQDDPYADDGVDSAVGAEDVDEDVADVFQNDIDLQEEAYDDYWDDRYDNDYEDWTGYDTY